MIAIVAYPDAIGHCPVVKNYDISRCITAVKNAMFFSES